MTIAHDIRVRFLTLFLPLAALVAAVAFGVGQFRIDAEIHRMAVSEDADVRTGAAELTTALERPLRHLASLPREAAIRAGIEDPSPEHLLRMEEGLSTLLSRNPGYDQARWIDQTGRERVRVDQTERGPAVIAEALLQNKADRYYFSDSVRLAPGEIYVSAIDLNIENGRVQIPFRPMLRIATPVADSAGNRRGIIIINILAAPILAGLAEMSTPNVMLLNQRGFWLRGPNPADEWGFVFGRDDTLERRSPAVWAEISNSASGSFLSADGLWTWRKVMLEGGPNTYRVVAAESAWIVATHQSAEVIGTIQTGIWTPIALIASPLLLIFAVFSGYAVVRSKGREESQRALEEASATAEAANRAKSAFLATMSHEIRTPMNGVLGMLELLTFTKLDPGQRRSLEIVRESGRSLLRIIDDILDFSKIEAGKLEVRPEVTSVAATVESVFHIYSSLASSKGLLMRRRVDDRIGAALLVDSLRLKQILNNFVSNAIKFTGEGHVEIAAELVERKDGLETVRFEVKDTGAGIAPETQQKLFQPFTQADSDTTRRFGGTGLGLAICRRLASLMRGTVEMTSEVGKGTTAILTLPMPIADPKDLPTNEPVAYDPTAPGHVHRRAPPSVEEAEAEGTLVLIAEDHPINSMILMAQLGTLGYAAEVTENGLEALESWKSGRFALLIADCHMPILDGYGLARAIRQHEAETGQARRPVIACTANALRGDAEACFAAGMDDYLAKPVAIIQLARKLDQWLPLPQSPHSPSPAEETEEEPAAIGQPAKPSPLDPQALAAVVGYDSQAQQRILRRFRDAHANDADQLTQAFDDGDVSQVASCAHRIKGASRMIGAMDMGTVCEQIESAARDGDGPQADRLRPEFLRESARLTTFLAELPG